VPYESVFVDAADARLLSGVPNVHVRDTGVVRHFERWKLAAMRRVLTAAPQCADPPKVVEQTRALNTREDRMRTFVVETVLRTGDDRDKLFRRDLLCEYRAYCRDQRPAWTALSKAEFNADIARVLGSPIAKSAGDSNFWRGFRLMYHGGGASGDELD
jgi:hypothetical protein